MHLRIPVLHPGSQSGSAIVIGRGGGPVRRRGRGGDARPQRFASAHRAEVLDWEARGTVIPLARTIFRRRAAQAHLETKNGERGSGVPARIDRPGSTGTRSRYLNFRPPGICANDFRCRRALQKRRLDRSSLPGFTRMSLDCTHARRRPSQCIRSLLHRHEHSSIASSAVNCALF